MKNEIDLLELSMVELINHYEMLNDGLIIYPDDRDTDGFFFYSNTFLEYKEDVIEKKLYMYMKKYKTRKVAKIIHIYDEEGKYIGEAPYEKRFSINKIYPKLRNKLRYKKLLRVLKYDKKFINRNDKK